MASQISRPALFALAVLTAIALSFSPLPAAADDCTDANKLQGTVVAGECQVGGEVFVSGTLNITQSLRVLSTGRINVPPAPVGNTPSSLTINITGGLTLDAPTTAGLGAINGNALAEPTGASRASNISITAGGNIWLRASATQGASITANANLNTCSGPGQAGNITVVSTGGDITVDPNARITSRSQCPTGEVIVRAPSGDVRVDGTVSSTSGFSGGGFLTTPKGGPVTVIAGCALTVGATGDVRSSGLNPGADRVHLESGCDTIIHGHVRSDGGIQFPTAMPNKCVEGTRASKAPGPTACVEIWSARKVTIVSPPDGAIFAESGQVVSLSGTCCSWIDIFALGDISVTGPSLIPTDFPLLPGLDLEAINYAINARQYAGNARGGIVTIKSVNGKVDASGGFVTSSALTNFGGTGGTVEIEAGGPVSVPAGPFDPLANVNFTNSWVQAGGTSFLGTILVRSYNGDITGTLPSLLDASGLGGTATLTVRGCRIPSYSGIILPPTSFASVQCGGSPTLPGFVTMPRKPVIVTVTIESPAGNVVPSGTVPFGQFYQAVATVRDAVTLQPITTPPPTLAYFLGTSQLGGAPVDPDVYNVVGTFPGDATYAAGTGTTRLEIFVGTISLSLTGNHCVYSGNPCPATATGLLDGVPRTPVVTYTIGASSTTTPPVDAGTYAVTASLAGLTENAVVVIDPLVPTITFSGIVTVTYDGNPHGASADVIGINGQTIAQAQVSYNGATTPVPTNAGTYTVTAAFAGLSPNYSAVPVTTASAPIVINQAVPRVFVENVTVTYSGAAFSVTGRVEGVGAPPQQLGVPSLSYVDAGGTVLTSLPVLPGVYTVIGTYTGTTNPNYVPATGAGSVTVTGTGQLTINPIVATINVANPIFTYDGNPHAGTATVSGVGLTTADNALITLAYTGTAGPSTPPVNAGSYPVHATFAKTGYLAQPASGTVTVNPATATITLTGGTFPFDGFPHPAVGNVTGPGLTPTVPTIVYAPAGPPVAPGIYTATATFTSDPNYTAAPKTATVTITSVTLNVVGFVGTYDGLPHPSTATLVDQAGVPISAPVTLTYNGSSSAPVNANTYNVVATFAGNASFPPATGTATSVISPATPTVTVTGGTFAFDDEDHPATATVTGVGGASLGAATSITYSGPTPGVPHAVGVYTATASWTSNNANYTNATGTGTVTITEAPTEACVVVDFREITYFENSKVITSSDAGIRSANGISGPFDPALWPYSTSGGSKKTESRGALFRIYGFKATELGVGIPDAAVSGRTYPVVEDTTIPGPGRYYIELRGPGGPVGGQPAKVFICPSQLQTNIIDQTSVPQGDPGVLPGSTALTSSQKNVPGIMLTHNASQISIPSRVRTELAQLGMPISGTKGVVDYIGVQTWGGGSSRFREFIDVEVTFVDDSKTDRVQHYLMGFHTANNINFEGQGSSCNYIDHDAGNDTMRFNDVWEGSKVSHPEWGPACGSREPSANEKRRENYAVPFNAVQMLSSVNTNSDTVRLFYGEIRTPVNEAPTCATAEGPGNIWPPNHKFEPVKVKNVKDPEGNGVDIVITGIFQDEATLMLGSGSTAIDAYGVGTSTAWVRAERSGLGDGRLYIINFTATDSNGASCTGTVFAGVPHDQGQQDLPVDSGLRFDSTTPGVPQLP
jgi:hypothetical protein